MKKRCESPKSDSYENYGGRGIKVCERWQTFENFLADMGQRPTSDHTIERIDLDGNYEPNNCIWIPRREQFLNMRKSVKITINGDTRIVAEWARLYKINPYTVYDRLDAGWSPADAVLTPPRGKRQTA